MLMSLQLDQQVNPGKTEELNMAKQTIFKIILHKILAEPELS
jgi:hypothetical protein